MSEIEEIWKSTNISTILFLKLFEHICSTAEIKTNGYTVRYPIHYLAYEYGLLNCFISKDYRLLKLVFDKESAISDRNLTSSCYYSFIDRLIDSHDYHSIEVRNKDKLLIVSLKLPLKFINDILLIVNTSKFSATSIDFKNAMKSRDIFKTKKGTIEVPLTSNPKVRYIITNDLPYGIVNKGKKLEENIKNTLNMSNIDAEYFINWNNDRELYTELNINKYV